MKLHRNDSIDNHRSPSLAAVNGRRLLAGGILLMLSAGNAWASYCGEPAGGHGLSTGGASAPGMEHGNDRQKGHDIRQTQASQGGLRSLVQSKALLDVRHGEGVRIICKHVDGVDTQEERNFQLDDIWTVETGDGRVMISAWEDDANRNVVSSARIELDLSQPGTHQTVGRQTIRRANAAHCPKTATGRCSSTIDVQSSVRALGNRFQVEQVTYVNGARTEWVVWLLEK